MTIKRSYQDQAGEWALVAFGPTIAEDQVERAQRFLEEALELFQAMGRGRDEALALVDYVYGRPAGDPPQEVGGVFLTLYCLCAAAGIDGKAAAYAELDRVWGKIEEIRRKQAAKPKGSPLPGPRGAA